MEVAGYVFLGIFVFLIVVLWVNALRINWRQKP